MRRISIKRKEERMRELQGERVANRVESLIGFITVVITANGFQRPEKHVPVHPINNYAAPAMEACLLIKQDFCLQHFLRVFFC